MAELPPLDNVPPGSAAPEWLKNRIRLRHLIMIDDPRHFIEWDVIQKTMFVHNAPYIKKELATLRHSPQWMRRWKQAIREDHAGLPPRSKYYLFSSGNLIHHAYSLLRFEQETGRTIDQFQRIVEFGGGYGSFCRLVHRLGFHGSYLLFDLPEFSALQQYFLESVGIPVSDNLQSGGARCISDVEALIKNLASSPNWLFVGLWSISETPEDYRYRVLCDGANISGYLLAYQERFGEVDNVAFFVGWMRNHNNIRWSCVQIPHLPGNAYLFGASLS